VGASARSRCPGEWPNWCTFPTALYSSSRVALTPYRAAALPVGEVPLAQDEISVADVEQDRLTREILYDVSDRA
jgi:hypothetical protein